MLTASFAGRYGAEISIPQVFHPPPRPLPSPRVWRGDEDPYWTLTIEGAQSQPHVSLGEAQHDALVFEVLGELLQLF